MKLEPLNIADTGLALALEHDANLYPWTESAFVSSFTSSYLNYKLIDVNRNLLGFYIAQQLADQIELFNICVAKSEQGKGYGKVLLNHFIAEGKSRGAVEALLEVRSSNHAAIALYQHKGFTANGLRKGYYTGVAGKEDALLMHCLIG